MTMSDQQLLDLFSRTLRDLLADDSIILTMSTKRGDVANWDSFNYINFIAAVEMELTIRFAVADVEAFENIGAIVQRAKVLIAAKS